MALMDESGNSMVMPVAPMCNTGNGSNAFGGDWAWIILLLLLAGNGWGNGFGGGADGLYPWMNQSDVTTRGFQNASVQSSLGDIQTQLCNGFAGVNATVNGGFANAEVSANARQMANMNQMFDLSTQFANCCCENRLGTADLKYTIATENCADRQALNEGVRDIIASQTAGTQRILDQLCADKIDAKNEKIVELQNQLNMATLRESQIAQNAFIQQGFSDEVDQLYNRLSNCPVPSTPVYGRTPIFTCNQNSCGCGCGNF